MALTLPDELIVILTAMTPVGELRASVPLAILNYDQSWIVAFCLSVIGNLIPIPIILYGLRIGGARLERQQGLLGKMLRWRTSRVEKVWGPRIRRYGFFGIVLVVAIPLPFTGAWTGALTVWALHQPAWRGLTAIGVGVVIAGSIVTALTVAGVELIKLG